jgi:hypothetical protein
MDLKGVHIASAVTYLLFPALSSVFIFRKVGMTPECCDSQKMKCHSRVVEETWNPVGNRAPATVANAWISSSPSAPLASPSAASSRPNPTPSRYYGSCATRSDSPATLSSLTRRPPRPFPLDYIEPFYFLLRTLAKIPCLAKPSIHPRSILYFTSHPSTVTPHASRYTS